MKLKLSVTLLALALLVTASAPAHADLPGAHPAYLHALSDLKAARWLVQHRPGDPAVSANEGAALQQIDGAIHDIKIAASYDGKNVHDHPPVDLPPDRPGRLHKALEALHRAHDDVNREEDNPTLLGLRNSSAQHIDAAIQSVEAAIYAAGSGY